MHFAPIHNTHYQIHNTMLQDHILCHYGEIALKGKNRNYFEWHLIENIKDRLDAFSPSSFEYVKKMSGGILIKLNEKGIANSSLIEDALQHTFGIVNFSFAASVEQDIEILKNTCWELIQNENFETFRVKTQRSNKLFPMTSEEINRKVGGFIFDKFEGKKSVSLKNADCECFIIIINKLALITLRKIQGPGGLPIGTGGKAMVLMSGGFDSPVAAWYLLKRGVSTRFAHFHSIPYTSRESLEKVTDLIKVLKKFKSSSVMYSIPFADVQKEIMMKCPASLRVILYRRMMMRIADVLAKKEKALALITGDSVGQVASQTLENILAVSQAATLPIFRPLIGMDKEEIMEKARQIGTYDISKLPHDDCCTRLMPKNPETRAKLPEVLEAEKALDIEKIIFETIQKTEKIMVN
ncbi:MAG: putative tRNA sulfurtransferase [Candidatus Moranbacteria bacterium GW2011_GWC2_37_8]|nr:MAG: putative tRNA sulfurtransferase [Candidatus Moranbacteria bacterium GW2011_GWC2_37_8]KKQ63065.1 MAG: putative tRNA sulfurtransferase [Parcubacteria group bacterium GW2011_GWC1_38_22]KKQ80397.1 MAG: putative tRNA sulfurtransferase [Candidatus Moranbacteria bacterium GW2011_GWD2_38_7]